MKGRRRARLQYVRAAWDKTWIRAGVRMARQLSIHHDVDRDEVVINGVRYHASVFEWLANPSPGVAYTFERRDEVVCVKRVEPSGRDDDLAPRANEYADIRPMLPADAIYSFIPVHGVRFDAENYGAVAFDAKPQLAGCNRASMHVATVRSDQYGQTLEMTEINKQEAGSNG